MLFAYSVKVLANGVATNLWGNETLPGFSDDLLLVVKLDLDAEPITLSQIAHDGTVAPLGELNPGEIYGFPLKQLKAVSAGCKPPNQDTTVMCALIQTK